MSHERTLTATSALLADPHLSNHRRAERGMVPHARTGRQEENGDLIVLCRAISPSGSRLQENDVSVVLRVGAPLRHAGEDENCRVGDRDIPRRFVGPIRASQPQC